MGEEYAVDIRQISPHGEGIARVKGFLVLISNAKRGDHVKVKITNIDSVSAYAEIANRV